MYNYAIVMSSMSMFSLTFVSQMHKFFEVVMGIYFGVGDELGTLFLLCPKFTSNKISGLLFPPFFKQKRLMIFFLVFWICKSILRSSIFICHDVSLIIGINTAYGALALSSRVIKLMFVVSTFFLVNQANDLG